MMDKFIQEMIDRGLGNLMDRSRDEMMESDEVYLEDSRREEEAKRRVLNLDLTEDQRAVIECYFECMKACEHRYADIGYMAGARDAVRMLVSLNLLKGVDAEG